MISAEEIKALMANRKRAIKAGLAKGYTVDGETAFEIIATLQTLLNQAAESLSGLLSDIVEYQTINNLGGENNHWQVYSKKALAALEPYLTKEGE